MDRRQLWLKGKQKRDLSSTKSSTSLSHILLDYHTYQQLITPHKRWSHLASDCLICFHCGKTESHVVTSFIHCHIMCDLVTASVLWTNMFIISHSWFVLATPGHICSDLVINIIRLVSLPACFPCGGTYWPDGFADEKKLSKVQRKERNYRCGAH